MRDCPIDRGLHIGPIVPDERRDRLEAVSSELARDTLFTATGLTFSVIVSSVYFPNEPFDPDLIGSNGCEQYFVNAR